MSNVVPPEIVAQRVEQRLKEFIVVHKRVQELIPSRTKWQDKSVWRTSAFEFWQSQQELDTVVEAEVAATRCDRDALAKKLELLQPELNHLLKIKKVLDQQVSTKSCAKQGLLKEIQAQLLRHPELLLDLATNSTISQAESYRESRLAEAARLMQTSSDDVAARANAVETAVRQDMLIRFEEWKSDGQKKLKEIETKCSEALTEAEQAAFETIEGLKKAFEKLGKSFKELEAKVNGSAPGEAAAAKRNCTALQRQMNGFQEKIEVEQQKRAEVEWQAHRLREDLDRERNANRQTCS